MKVLEKFMGNIVHTEQQIDGIRRIVHWRHISDTRQVFRLFGYAGTGKSTLVKAAVDDLGLRDGEVFYATLTGKAAHVLRQMGVPATTIHSLIYTYCPVSKAQIDAIEVEIAEIKARAEMFGRVADKTLIAQKLDELRKLKSPRFTLNEESVLRDAKLLVLDECSMVDKKTADDLKSFGVPILLIGDPGQLGPIKGESGFTTTTDPDIFLTEIHRQALDSPIIQAATLARQGKLIPFGAMGDTVVKGKRHHLDASDLLKFDQVICGCNKTRLSLNNAMRQAKGLDSPLPVPEDKIIIQRNKHDHGLFNGQFVQMTNVHETSHSTFHGSITTDEGVELFDLACYSGEFLDHQNFDKDRDMRDWKLKSRLIEATYGYALTVHKSQGSGFGSVCLIDDWKSGAERNRWLYTGITRAANSLVILA
jgi:exodeoxyribonuclease-5